jgi:hypothetical protein
MRDISYILIIINHILILINICLMVRLVTRNRN